ncbi:hypothetical protein [Jiangella asiatica]|uniref:Uncharacterized protein n=1 Tax=Jiangella asiatica TaxID=2530372 RepID=A0A4R5CRJ1_9ACTN|nr:hypothetical protein [Jiangella asiatica]TDE01980.1 hypothetical protein E1269_22290 [Jiangella asiatica]
MGTWFGAVRMPAGIPVSDDIVAAALEHAGSPTSSASPRGECAADQLAADEKWLDVPHDAWLSAAYRPLPNDPSTIA